MQVQRARLRGERQPQKRNVALVIHVGRAPVHQAQGMLRQRMPKHGRVIARVGVVPVEGESGNAGLQFGLRIIQHHSGGDGQSVARPVSDDGVGAEVVNCPALAVSGPRGLVGPFHRKAVGRIYSKANGDAAVGEIVGGKNLRQRSPLLLGVDGTGGAAVTVAVFDPIHAQRQVRALQLGDAGGVVVDGGRIVRRGGEGIAPPGGRCVLVRHADAQRQQRGGTGQGAKQTKKRNRAADMSLYFGLQVFAFVLMV